MFPINSRELRSLGSVGRAPTQLNTMDQPRKCNSARFVYGGKERKEWEGCISGAGRSPGSSEVSTGNFSLRSTPKILREPLCTVSHNGSKILVSLLIVTKEFKSNVVKFKRLSKTT